jgi:hypothetical protein
VINRGKREQVEPGDVFSIVKNAKPVTLIMADGEKKKSSCRVRALARFHLPRLTRFMAWCWTAPTQPAWGCVNAPEGE